MFSLLSTALAANGALTATIEIPRLAVAEYHRPYTAIWIQTPRGAPEANLAVWYDTELRDDEGETWLKDLRQWWRRVGRSADLPIDGVSGPTRAPGTHEVTLAADDPRLQSLEPGEYELVFEAAREVGGRELLTIPFTWPATEPLSLSAEGERELGMVGLSLNP
ncbi:DUF2271 domain-containing protein [Parvularcula oceani]|uniref:DUF2271 domain-containing protein n=1 Tax=Parvularcula oceani TaxID=1247963 RepID=UPI0004E19538|nr:DUF2271 domain-containing protein [Parvularcula oceani]